MCVCIANVWKNKNIPNISNQFFGGNNLWDLLGFKVMSQGVFLGPNPGSHGKPSHQQQLDLIKPHQKSRLYIYIYVHMYIIYNMDYGFSMDCIMNDLCI